MPGKFLFFEIYIYHKYAILMKFYSFVCIFRLEEYDGECVPAGANYDGLLFLLQLHIGLVNGKGIKCDYFKTKNTYAI